MQRLFVGLRTSAENFQICNQKIIEIEFEWRNILSHDVIASIV